MQVVVEIIYKSNIYWLHIKSAMIHKYYLIVIN